MTTIASVSQNVLKRFSCFLESGRLAHAYLFVGPKGIGKVQTALAIAKLVNCEDDSSEMFCDDCSACKKIDRISHPDIHIVGEEGKSIKIEEIRQVIAEVQLRPFEAKMKVFLINDAEKLTPEASNALLKTLEEPSRNSLIFLTTSAEEQLLGTIKSRCQIIHFFPTTNAELKEQLMDKKGCSEECSHFLAYFSEGCIGKINEEDFEKILARKNEAIDQFMFQEDNENYLKKVLADKDKTKEVIQFLFSWIKDLLMAKNNISCENFIHKDRVGDLQEVKERYTFQEIEDILNEIVLTKRAADENFNVKVPLAIIKEKIWKK